MALYTKFKSTFYYDLHQQNTGLSTRDVQIPKFLPMPIPILVKLPMPILWFRYIFTWALAAGTLTPPWIFIHDTDKVEEGLM